MSYISRMKQEIKKDIKTCEELLKRDYVESKEFSDLIGKYLTKYLDFSNGLKLAELIDRNVLDGSNDYKKLESYLEQLEIEYNTKIFSRNLEII